MTATRRYVAVLLEDIRGSFKAFGESLGGLNVKVDAIATDVAVLKTDVAVLKTDVAVLKTDVAVLKTDMAEVKARVTRVEHAVNGAAPRRKRR
jgi:outer membrane murein-binding lipoprotein Lpp